MPLDLRVWEGGALKVMTRKPGDLPVAVVLRSAEVRRTNGISRETTTAVAVLESAGQGRSFDARTLAFAPLAVVEPRGEGL
jgi:hypothetical protein